MEERRKFFRFDCPIDVKYISGKAKSPGRSRTKNISREGLAFSADKRIAKKEKLKMEFEIPGDNIPISAEGIVAWVKKNKTDRRKVFDIGIKLIDIARLDRGRILEYAYNKWLKVRNIKTKK